MTKKEVQVLVEECAIPMLVAMGISTEWEITWKVRKENTKYPSRVAEMGAKVNYQKADITFFYPNIPNREHFLDYIRHELLHVSQAPFDGFWNTVLELIPKDKYGEISMSCFALDTQYHRDCEHNIIHLERMLNSLGMTPKRILAIGKKKLK